MNIIEILTTIFNSILLIIFLIYQIIKNKTLIDRINTHSKLLSETNELINKQKITIENQSTVVSSALKYTEVFDVSKIEQLVKREMTVEHKEKIRELEEKYKLELASSKDRSFFDDIIKKMVESIMYTTLPYITSLFEHPLHHYLKYLISLTPENRHKEIESINDIKSREFISSIVLKLENKIETITPYKIQS